MNYPGYPKQYDEEAAQALDAYDREFRSWDVHETADGRAMMFRHPPLDAPGMGASNVTIASEQYFVERKDTKTIRRHAAMRAALNSVITKKGK